MNEEYLKKAHICSSFNRNKLSKARLCGCFYCLKIFDPKLVVDWCDDNQTAICPFCGIDSIIHDCKEFPLSREFLEKMNEYWFNNSDIN